MPVSTDSALTIAFLARRPMAAARVLAAMDAGDAAAFLETIPLRFAARALTYMSAWPAAVILTRMTAAGGAGVVRELHYQDAAAILRLTEPAVRSGILEHLSASLRRDFQTSLSYPEDTVGAHMDVAVVTLGRGHTIADACDQIRRADQGPAAQQEIFVLYSSRKLAGVVPMSALVQYAPETTIGDVTDEGIAAISARARIADIVDLEDWDEHSQLPVVSRRQHFIGALSRRSIRRATEVSALRDADAAPALPISLAGAMVTSVSGLLGMLMAPSGSARRPDAETGS
jgi:magnesium transporter